MMFIASQTLQMQEDVKTDILLKKLFKLFCLLSVEGAEIKM